MTLDHRQLGVDLFNRTWTLLERDDRSPDDDDELIDAAHASAHHWRYAEGVRPENRAAAGALTASTRSAGRTSRRVTRSAARPLRRARPRGLGPRVAYEALARAHKLAGDEAECARNVELARAVAIADDEDREHLEESLATLGGLGEEPLEAVGVVERPDHREVERVATDHVLRHALDVLGGDRVERLEHLVGSAARPRAPRAAGRT